MWYITIHYDTICYNSVSYDMFWYDTLRSFTMHYVVWLLIIYYWCDTEWCDTICYNTIYVTVLSVTLSFSLHYVVSLPYVNATEWYNPICDTTVCYDLIRYNLLQYSVNDDAWWSILIINDTIPHDGILTQMLAWHEKVLNIFLWSLHEVHLYAALPL